MRDFATKAARSLASASKTIKFTFNTECIECTFGEQDVGAGTSGSIDVLDAIAHFELSPQFNIWVGRMLTPADRIEMNGPYYGLSWNQYNLPLLPLRRSRRCRCSEHQGTARPRSRRGVHRASGHAPGGMTRVTVGRTWP